MSQLLSITTAATLATTPSPLQGLRPVRREGSRVVILCDATGAAVCAELPAEDYHRMSASVRREIGGRPHIQTWCNLHGRTEIPATLVPGSRVALAADPLAAGSDRAPALAA